ncbi:hypothetical protein EG68_00243 [Paragonimus skrjabini miyazakii]|uniref:Uncharacterized protein n=1 Tax=Paragonimus skrjabini miyazakii TaxID=59628 RepID=A0A8S9Z9F9_9TREM|nr:hypothetical protein EG68_00243 [Paragonimus skrjabini miyazakii]
MPVLSSLPSKLADRHSRSSFTASLFAISAETTNPTWLACHPLQSYSSINVLALFTRVLAAATQYASSDWSKARETSAL